MKLNNEQLCRAAALADVIELASLPDEESCPKHTFSPEFEAEMQELFQKIANNEVKLYRVSMGWSYYTKRGVAAVLIGFFLTCIAMPEVVIAGYHKLIDVIETVVTEYTEYKYHSSVPGNAEFIPLEFGYLPDRMQLVDKSIEEKEMYVMYREGQNYFILEQMLITENSRMEYMIDTENARVETRLLFGSELDLSYKNDEIIYVWTYDKYLIAGQCNISDKELEKILYNLVIN